MLNFIFGDLKDSGFSLHTNSAKTHQQHFWRQPPWGPKTHKRTGQCPLSPASIPANRPPASSGALLTRFGCAEGIFSAVQRREFCVEKVMFVSVDFRERCLRGIMTAERAPGFGKGPGKEWGRVQGMLLGESSP